MKNSSQNDNYLIIRVRELLNAGFDIPKTAKQLNLTVPKVNKLILTNIPSDKICTIQKQAYWINESEMQAPNYTMEMLSQNEIEFYNSYGK